MKKIVSKLRSRAGETFSEVMIALLIVALSALLLSALVSASGQVDMAVRQDDEKFYESLSDLETHEGTPEDKQLSITMSGTIEKSDGSKTPISEKDTNVNVNVYESGGMISYSAKEDTP